MRSATPAMAAMGVALIGVAILALGALLDLDAFMRAYFTGVMIALQLPLGCLALLIAHRLLAGRWGEVIGGALEAGTRTLPFMALLFLPVLLRLQPIYPWLDGGYLDAHETVAAKTAYLNGPFFIARSLLYLALWSGLALALAGGRTAPRAVAVAGAVLLPVTVGFASIDWLMSLEPTFDSTAYGLMVLSSDAVGALALALLATLALVERQAGAAALQDVRLVGLGSLMLGLVLLWAYHAYMQLLVAWSGNLPAHAEWYLTRIEGGWLAAVWSLGIGHLALPVLLLLSGRVRRSQVAIMALAALLLAMRLLDWLWLILPAFRDRPLPGWLAAAALAALLGLWTAAFLRGIEARAARITRAIEASRG